MKIYLSKYWIAGHISLVCVEVAVVVATAAFCIEYRDEENILLIICSLVLIGITYGQYILGKPANGLGNRAIYQPAAS